MDATAVGIAIFGLLKIAIWLSLIAFAIWLWRSISLTMNSVDDESETTPPDLGEVLWDKRYWLGGWVMLFFAAIFFTQQEMAYRPKTVVQPTNAALEQQLRELDRTAAPEIGVAEGDLRDAANTGYSDRNAAENTAAREAFQSLPDDKK